MQHHATRCNKQDAWDIMGLCAEVSDIYLEAHPWTVSNGGLLDNLCLCQIMGHALEPYCAFMIFYSLIIFSNILKRQPDAEPPGWRWRERERVIVSNLSEIILWEGMP
jgi:hypothetical protein